MSKQTDERIFCSAIKPANVRLKLDSTVCGFRLVSSHFSFQKFVFKPADLAIQRLSHALLVESIKGLVF